MKSLLYPLLFSLLLTSCGLYGRYERNTSALRALTDSLYRLPQQTVTPSSVHDTLTLGHLPWRELFVDAHLQKLIDKALVQNTDLRKAELLIQQAEIGLRINKLAYLPTLSFAPSGTLAKTFIEGADQMATYDLPLQAAWQIDAFGALRNAKEQGKWALLQAKAGHQAARTAIISTVANLYYSLQMLDEQLAITRSTLAVWTKNVETMQAMKEAGMTHSAAVASAQAQLVQIQNSLPTIEQNILEVEHSLCLLLHEAPHSIVRSSAQPMQLPSTLSLGLPFQVLSHRPDVAMAEAKLAQAFYGIQAARSAFYPRLTISAQGKFTNSVGALVLNPGKFIAAGVASLAQPIFAQGKLKGHLEMSRLQQQTAQLDFERALLTAGQEVSNAFSKCHMAQLNVEMAEQRLALLRKANEDTDYLFRNGNTTSYLETLTAQMNLLNGQLSLTNQRYAQAQSTIALYKALGGGRE